MQQPVYMIFVMVLAGGLVSAALGFLTGALTLRLKGVYFSIATLAMAVVLENLVTNRSEEHTSELQSLMRISYAVFCLKKKKTRQHKNEKKKQEPPQNII